MNTKRPATRTDSPQKGSEIVKNAIKKLMDGKDLSRTESRLVMNDIMDNRATDSQISAYLVALRLKGETVDEIAGSAQAFTDTAAPVSVKDENIVDTCGTGGDNLSTFNISTASAFVAAGAGVRVAKHGHRGISSKCGSADLLAEFGIKVDIPRRTIARCFREIGLAFLFAPRFHKSWQYALGPRREIGARTIFNILGPITNPARTRRQLIGVYDDRLMRTVLEVMRELGAIQVMVVHGQDGLDEITITGKTHIIELIDGSVYEYDIYPEDFNMNSAPISSIQTHSCLQNVEIFNDVLHGKPGPALDTVLLNAGAAIKVSGKVASLQDGIELARISISSGQAWEKLKKLMAIAGC